MLGQRLGRYPNINPVTAKSFNWNFHKLEVVSTTSSECTSLKTEVNDFEILSV